MKVKLEFGQYEIEIEEKDGSIVVSAEKEGEIVEEFKLPMEDLEGEESMGEEGEELMPFDSEEEEDFSEMDEEDMDEEDMDDMEEESEESEMKLESFSSFVSKRR